MAPGTPVAMPEPATRAAMSMIEAKKTARTASAQTRPMISDQREAGVRRSLSK